MPELVCRITLVLLAAGVRHCRGRIRVLFGFSLSDLVWLLTFSRELPRFFLNFCCCFAATDVSVETTPLVSGLLGRQLGILRFRSIAKVWVMALHGGVQLSGESSCDHNPTPDHYCHWGMASRIGYGKYLLGEGAYQLVWYPDNVALWQ